MYHIMKKYTYSLFLLTIFTLSMYSSYAQTALKKGNKLYDAMAYSQAIPQLESALKKDANNSDAMIKLADCYRLTNNSEMAEMWYAKVVASGVSKPIHQLYYAQALMTNGKYADAKKWMDTYHASEPNDMRPESSLKSIDNISSYTEDAQNFKIEKININSPDADFGAVAYRDGIVFASTRERNQPVRRTDMWTGKKFLALYKAVGRDANFQEPIMFEKSIQTIYNDGPICFNKAGDEMYVTTNNIEEGKVRKSTEGVVKLKIYKYKFENKEWAFEDTFPPNNDQYNVAHPSLSADGNQLYFASDMPGGMGGMDIYVCTKKDKTWTSPVNLGEGVNTKGNEVFPTIKSDGTLYFSSNGRDGVGGLDIYSAQQKGDKWGDVRNLFAPINSRDDDFGLVFNANDQTGYFSSNRGNSEKSKDDNIYFFTSLKPQPVTYTITLKDSVTETDLSDAELTVTDAEGKVNNQKSNNGTFTMDLLPNKTYTVKTNVFAYINQQLEWITSKTELTKVIKLQRALGIDLETIVLESFNNPKGVEGLTVNIAKVNTNKSEEFKTGGDGKVNSVLQPESTYYIIASGNGLTSNKYFLNTLGIKEGNKLYQTIYLDNTPDATANKKFCLLNGVLTDKTTNAPLSGAIVTFYDAASNLKKQEATTDASGKYLIYNLDLNQDYKVVASKEGYFTQSADISTKGLKECKTFTRNFNMDKIVLNKAIKIDNIYFDVAKWNIRPDAAKELNKVVKLLKDNPTIIIELSSHTDSRGSSESNMKLSDNRAKASAQYIIDNGIDKARVTGKGYGETQPLNKCIDGVTCTDKEYQVNRRTEFKVVGNVTN